MSKPYGYELILDLEGCDVKTFNRREIDKYFAMLCNEINMQRCERFWWDDVNVPENEKQTSPHTKGTSAVQFILTSSIVIHTLELTGQAFVNIFSCKSFDSKAAVKMTMRFFHGELKQCHWLKRG